MNLLFCIQGTTKVDIGITNIGYSFVITIRKLSIELLMQLGTKVS